MAKISPCFKRIFVLCNVLFAILGAVILGLCLVVQFSVEEEYDNKLLVVVVLGVIGSITFILAFLGAYGAQKENKNVLTAFFVFLCVAVIILLRAAIPMAISRQLVTSMVKNELNSLVPLDKSDAGNGIDFIQKQAKCCGLFNGYRDWENEVPASCDCENKETDQCERITSRPIELFSFGSTNRMVYSRSCGSLMMEYFEMILNIMLGVLFGLAVLAILGCVMSLAMVIRITAMPLNTAFSLHPPKYSELITTA